MTSMIPTQKMKCASRAQMLGFAPYITCALGKGASCKINKLHTWLAKCASRVQAKCALKSTPDRLVCTLLAPDRTKPT